MLVFLDLIAWHFGAEEPDVVNAMLAVASGGSREADLASWIRSESVRREGPYESDLMTPHKLAPRRARASERAGMRPHVGCRKPMVEDVSFMR